MGKNKKGHGIEWLNGWLDEDGQVRTPETFNPVWGCSHKSEGCRNCYAEAMALRLRRMGNQPNYEAVITDGRWNGEVVADYAMLEKIRRWKKPRVAFVCSMSDLFHEKVPDAFILAALWAMADNPEHIFILLTKREKRMAEMWRQFTEEVNGCPVPKNIIQGVTVENESQLGRLDHLIRLPVKKLVSVEPMLGPLDLSPWMDQIDWVILGCESGPRARLCEPSWVRPVRDNCVATGTPFFLKQMMIWNKLVKMPILTQNKNSRACKRWAQLPKMGAV